jgi:hypothetical protein
MREVLQRKTPPDTQKIEQNHSLGGRIGSKDLLKMYFDRRMNLY